jgi:hypothetical protein
VTTSDPRSVDIKSIVFKGLISRKIERVEILFSNFFTRKKCGRKKWTFDGGDGVGEKDRSPSSSAPQLPGPFLSSQHSSP